MKKRTILSKSKYMVGLTCPKYLWILYNKPELIPEVDEATQFIFDQGHLVNEYSRKLYPKAVDLSMIETDFEESFKRTEEALKQRKVIFEASIKNQNCYTRPDIFVPVGISLIFYGL